jgi:hypothetical protein
MNRLAARGGLVGVAALGISVLAMVAANAVGGTIAGGFALFTIAGIAILVRLMGRYLARAGVVASVAVLGWAPLAFGGVSWELGRPIVSSSWHCGTGDLQFFTMGVVVLTLACGITLGMSVVLSRTRIADGIVRVLAYASVIAGGVVAALAIARDGIEPDAWVEAQPIIADSTDTYEATVEGIRVGVADDVVILTSDHGVVRYPEDVGPTGQHGAAMRVRHEHERDRKGRFIIEQKLTTSWYPVHAYDADLASVDVTPHDVRASLKPPAGWVGSAVAGVGAAFVAIGLATWLDRRVRRLRSGKLAQGTHTGDGWIEIMGSATKHVPEAQMLPIGPVVFETKPPPAPTYREDGSVDVRRVKRGTLAEWIDRTLDMRASALAFAITAVALSCAPLAAARFAGLF